MDCFVACAPRNDGATVLSVIASASEAIHCRHKKGGLLRRVAPRKDSAVVAGKHHSCHTPRMRGIDRKSTRLNSSHLVISYAVFCLKKKKKKILTEISVYYT